MRVGEKMRDPFEAENQPSFRICPCYESKAVIWSTFHMNTQALPENSVAHVLRGLVLILVDLSSAKTQNW